MRVTPLLVWAACIGARPVAALEVQVVSTIDGTRAVADPSEKLVREGTTVTLHAVVSDHGKAPVADVPEVITTAHGSARRTEAPSEKNGPWQVRWFRIEAIDHYLSNTDPTFHWQEIHYRYTPIPDCEDHFSCPANLHTTVLEDRAGLGTMAFRVSVSRGAETAESPGYDERYRGGLRGDIPRVTVRRDDTYLGFLTELFNTPYIWGSAGDPSTVHQTERRIGSDCADFVTYGVRRLGHKEIPYTYTGALPKYTRMLFTSTGPDADGVYRDAKGDPIPFGSKGVRPGDLLLFPGHVAAVERDAPPLGILSADDVMIHTSWHEPTEQSIASSEYAGKPVKVVRWKVFDH
jgi:cell wall-associated NlpC family hydrolase